MLDAVSNNGKTLEFVDPLLQADKEVVIVAVSNSGPYYGGVRGLTPHLLYASEVLRGDRDVVRAAMALNGANLQYAADALKVDRDLVMEAMRSSDFSLSYLPAGSDLLCDRELVLEAVKKTGKQQIADLQYVDASLRAESRRDRSCCDGKRRYDWRPIRVQGFSRSASRYQGKIREGPLRLR